MTRTELHELIRNGENSGVEFKRDDVENRKLAKELVALTNFDGGVVLLGVEDDGTVSGITRANLEEWVMTLCRDKIRPEIIPYFEIVKDVEPGKDVAIVRVSQGLNPHHLWHDNHRTWFIRVGSQSREASDQELARLFQQRGDFRAELRPITGSSLRDLDLRRLRDYFVRVRDQDAPADEDEAGWRTLLANTELLLDEGPAEGAATLGALVLFGRSPARLLPQVGIDAAAYPGREKDYAARERTQFKGPLTPLYGLNGILENGVVEQAVDFVRRNTGVTAALTAGAVRDEKSDYPDSAIREAIVNALVHRDYLLSATDVELSLYTDRIEIVSPGKLPNGITPARMRAGCRAARNQMLKDTMRDYKYLEHMGMGIPRKVVKAMLAHNGTEPDLVAAEEQFTVRLWKDKHT